LTGKEQNNVVIILIESPLRVVLLIFIALHWQFGDGLASRCFQLPASTMCVPIREELFVTSVGDVESTGAAALGKKAVNHQVVFIYYNMPEREQLMCHHSHIAWSDLFLTIMSIFQRTPCQESTPL
jgi:hypothetical protein